MDYLMLKSGRYMRPDDSARDAGERLMALEDYLANLSEELEYRLGELERKLVSLDRTVKGGETHEATTER